MSLNSILSRKFEHDLGTVILGGLVLFVFTYILAFLIHSPTIQFSLVEEGYANPSDCLVDSHDYEQNGTPPETVLLYKGKAVGFLRLDNKGNFRFEDYTVVLGGDEWKGTGPVRDERVNREEEEIPEEYMGEGTGL